MNDILENYGQENVQKLTDVVEKATTETTKIITNKEKFKNYKAEFTQKLIEAIRIQFPNNDMTREEKITKKLFGKIISSIIDKDSTDKDNYLLAGFLRKRIEELIMLIYAYDYLQKDDIKNIFKEYKIDLQFNKIETYLTYLNDEATKSQLKYLVNECIDLQNNIDDFKVNIDETIYNEIPATLRYNKNGNPSGITKRLLQKFSLLNLLKKVNISKAKMKFDKMVEDSQTRKKADNLAVSIADTLVSEENK